MSDDPDAQDTEGAVPDAAFARDLRERLVGHQAWPSLSAHMRWRLYLIALGALVVALAALLVVALGLFH